MINKKFIMFQVLFTLMIKESKSMGTFLFFGFVLMIAGTLLLYRLFVPYFQLSE